MAKLKEYVMGKEEANKMEASEPKELQQPVTEEKDAAEEKSVIPVPESMLSFILCFSFPISLFIFFA